MSSASLCLCGDFKEISSINLILIGFKSCGKTVIGRELANRLRWRFIDLDQAVETLYLELHGQRLSSRKIFQNHGQVYFRDLEKQALTKLEQVDRCVISTGGGTFIHNPISASLKGRSKIIYPEVDPEVLYHRIIKRGIPAFFKPGRPYESLQTLLKERTPIYKSLADLVVNNSYKGIEKTVRKILQWLETVSANSL